MYVAVLLSEHDTEAHAVVAVAGDVVGLFYIGAPAVDTADTTDCAKHRDAGAAGVGQFRNMLRRLDFLGRVGQGAEGERLTGLSSFPAGLPQHRLPSRASTGRASVRTLPPRSTASSTSPARSFPAASLRHKAPLRTSTGLVSARTLPIPSMASLT